MLHEMHDMPENISNISDIPNAYASSNPKETTDTSEIINPEITSQSEENPNVYTQTNNVDFIDISSLNNEETPINNNIKTALNDLNIVNTSSNIFNDNKPSIEDKEVQKMENIPNISDLESQILTEPSAESKSNISKLKLATAIRLAKDTVEDIKTAGYTVTMEEVDSQKDYQIIIKVQK